MKSPTLIAGFIAALLLLSSCTKTPSNIIKGEWKIDEAATLALWESEGKLPVATQRKLTPLLDKLELEIVGQNLRAETDVPLGQANFEIVQEGPDFLITQHTAKRDRKTYDVRTTIVSEDEIIIRTDYPLPGAVAVFSRNE